MYQNQLNIIGFVGQSAEVSYLKSGVAVTKFSVATKVAWTDKDSGDRKDRTQWHNIVAYGDFFPKFAERIVKGAHVFVQGEHMTRTYDKTIKVQTGGKTVDVVIKATAVELKADIIRLLDRADAGDQTADQEPPADEPAAA